MRLIKNLITSGNQFVFASLLAVAGSAMILWGLSRLGRIISMAENGEAYHGASFADGLAVGYTAMAVTVACLVAVADNVVRLVRSHCPEEESLSVLDQALLERTRVDIRRGKLDCRRIKQQIRDDKGY